MEFWEIIDRLSRAMDEACATPGRKIRSKGKGRGLAVGQGKGPIGVPVGDKGSRRRYIGRGLSRRRGPGDGKGSIGWRRWLERLD